MSIRLLPLDIYALLPPGSRCVPHFYGSYQTNLVGLDLSTCPFKKIGFNCFSYAGSLQELILPEVLEEISSGSFRELMILPNLNLSRCKKLRVLDHDTFVDACSLQELILPEGLVEIRSGALRGLKILEYLMLPESVMTISSECFSNCPRLRLVILKGPTKIDANAFKGCHPSLTFVTEKEMLKKTYVFFWIRFCSLRSLPIVSPRMIACSESFMVYSTHAFFPWFPKRQKIMSRCNFGVISTIAKRLVAEKKEYRDNFYRRFFMEILRRFLARS
jgi:hypothetical protein